MATPTLEDIYREHFDYVYRQASRMGGAGFDAEDAAQEVFVVVARKLDTYDPSVLMTTWLYGITFNVVRHAWRRARLRRMLLLDHPSVEEAPAAPDAAEVGQARRIAEELLSRMRPKHREVFVLAELEGLGGDEIASLLGIKIQTVWSRLHTARLEFARRLAKRGLGRSS